MKYLIAGNQMIWGRTLSVLDVSMFPAYNIPFQYIMSLGAIYIYSVFFLQLSVHVLDTYFAVRRLTNDAVKQRACITT